MNKRAGSGGLPVELRMPDQSVSRHLAMPTLRQLQIFSYVYRLGSLTQAAQAMCLTQSAASVALQQMEETLGVRLFDRTGRTLRPTTPAREVFDMTQRVLSGMESLIDNARGLAGRHYGSVRFSVATSIAATIAPLVIRRFQSRYPGIQLIMHDVGPDQLIPPVLDQHVEFGIGTPDADTRAIKLTPLLRDRLAAVVLGGTPLALRTRLTWRDLDQVPVITVRPSNGIRSLIDNAMEKAGIDFEPAWEVSYLSTALALTAQGIGVSVLPGYLVAASQYPDLVTRVLNEPEVERNLYLISRREHTLSPAATALVEMFAEVLRMPV